MFNKPAIKKPIKPAVLSQQYKESIRSAAIIGKRGYTIPKDLLSPADLREMIQNLTLSPFQLPAFSAAVETVSIPVYQEIGTKFCIPRHYGVQRYGLPESTSLSFGEPLACGEFVKVLRDNQKPVVDEYLKNVYAGGYGGLLCLPCGFGKTIMAIYLCSKIRRKTLILVHKEFLMNQWIERIQEFLPTARIGIIQGDVCDMDNKDIVLGMIQTVYRRDYDYTSFGLTIIDEVHRIGSEEFSKTLLKVSTRLMLGISATLERKDGLTELIKMFLGEVLVSVTSREKNNLVLVRALTFRHPDREYNVDEFDPRTGYPRYSTMISKLCGFQPRAEYIIQVLRDLLEEDPDAQILVLAHNISLLEYLHDAIDFATKGYYKGGMKEATRKQSETKKIILGSYSMSSEGLDIKTVSTLVLATPKTDIIQCVGRILRSDDVTPKIVDIVDTHAVFQGQMRKRLAYYKKCGYTVEKGKTLFQCGTVTVEAEAEEEDDDTEPPPICNIMIDDDA